MHATNKHRIVIDWLVWVCFFMSMLCFFMLLGIHNQLHLYVYVIVTTATTLKYSSSVAGISGSRCCSLHERTS